MEIIYSSGESNFNASEKDDTTLNEVWASCRTLGGYDFSEIVPSVNTHWGSYHHQTNYCGINRAVCGIRTRLESFQGSGDDTALNGIKFACCDVN